MFPLALGGLLKEFNILGVTPRPAAFHVVHTKESSFSATRNLSATEKLTPSPCVPSRKSCHKFPPSLCSFSPIHGRRVLRQRHSSCKPQSAYFRGFKPDSATSAGAELKTRLHRSSYRMILTRINHLANLVKPPAGLWHPAAAALYRAGHGLRSNPSSSCSFRSLYMLCSLA